MLFGPISYMERGELQQSKFGVFLGMSGAFGVPVAEIFCANFDLPDATFKLFKKNYHKFIF
jgi:hypothetical protein